MEMQKGTPSNEEIDRANAFCHSFVRFLISENVTPENAIMYVGAAAAQVAINIRVATKLTDEQVANMFRDNMLYFMGLMGDRVVVYPVPRRQ